LSAPKNLFECTHPFSNNTSPFKGLPEVSVNLILTWLVSFCCGDCAEIVVVVVAGLIGDLDVVVGAPVIEVSFGLSSVVPRHPAMVENKIKITANSR
jgi:hypothetical protein